MKRRAKLLSVIMIVTLLSWFCLRLTVQAVEEYGYDPAQLDGGGSIMLDERAMDDGGSITMYVLIPEDYNKYPFAIDTCWYGMLYADEEWYPFGYSVSTLNFQYRVVDLEEKYGLDELGLQVWRYRFTVPPGEYNFSNCLDRGRCPVNGSWDYVIVLTQKLGLPFVEDGYHIAVPESDYPNAEVDTIEENNMIFPVGEKHAEEIYALMVYKDNYFNDEYYEALVNFGRAMKGASNEDVLEEEEEIPEIQEELIETESSIESELEQPLAEVTDVAPDISTDDSMLPEENQKQNGVLRSTIVLGVIGIIFVLGGVIAVARILSKNR